jgi:hypothetical protein
LRCCAATYAVCDDPSLIWDGSFNANIGRQMCCCGGGVAVRSAAVCAPLVTRDKTRACPQSTRTRPTPSLSCFLSPRGLWSKVLKSGGSARDYMDLMCGHRGDGLRKDTVFAHSFNTVFARNSFY